MTFDDNSIGIIALIVVVCVVFLSRIVDPWIARIPARWGKRLRLVFKGSVVVFFSVAFLAFLALTIAFYRDLDDVLYFFVGLTLFLFVFPLSLSFSFLWSCMLRSILRNRGTGLRTDSKAVDFRCFTLCLCVETHFTPSGTTAVESPASPFRRRAGRRRCRWRG